MQAHVEKPRAAQRPEAERGQAQSRTLTGWQGRGMTQGCQFEQHWWALGQCQALGDLGHGKYWRGRCKLDKEGGWGYELGIGQGVCHVIFVHSRKLGHRGVVNNCGHYFGSGLVWLIDATQANMGSKKTQVIFERMASEFTTAEEEKARGPPGMFLKVEFPLVVMAASSLQG